METTQPGKINATAESFFAEGFPLIKLFPYGNDIMIYDAKPHFSFILSLDELEVLIDFLRDVPTELLLKEHSERSGKAAVQALLTKFAELRSAGLFIPGPAAEISPVDRETVAQQLKYYDENIVLRKFCLGVTEDCNYRCTYCKRTVAKDYRCHSKTQLSEENAFKAIKYYFDKYTSVFQKLPYEKQKLLLQIAPPSLSFYGGEPLLNFGLIKKSAAYFKSLPWDRYSIGTGTLQFTSNTNLSIMNDEILHFLVDNRVFLFASLDGPEAEHDRCRVFENGGGTFQTSYRNLMRIKQFDEVYFRECVSIFGVYTDQHDFDRCIDFTRNLGALLCQHFPAEYNGTFVNKAAETAAEFERSLEDRLAAFKIKAAAEATQPDISLQEYAQLLPFAKLNTDHPAGKNSLQVSLTCPMGFDNLMVAASGDYLICHKVDDFMPIGHCEIGLDFEKLADLNQRYNSTINNEECKNCWNVNFCSVCAASRMAGDRFINPTRQECDYFRLRAAYDFLCFSHLALEQPGLLQRIFDFRNDRQKFIGIIDINDF